MLLLPLHDLTPSVLEAEDKEVKPHLDKLDREKEREKPYPPGSFDIPKICRSVPGLVELAAHAYEVQSSAVMMARLPSKQGA